MFFFTIWGGAEVQPKDNDNIVVTVWGGTDILMPTLAEKMIRLKKAKEESGEITDSVVRRTNVITLMAGTIYKTPTLAKEIEQMRQLKDSGSLTDQEMLQLWQDAIRRDDLDIFESLTIMGGVEEGHPSRKEELKDLDRITARGVISNQERDEIRMLIEKRPEAGNDVIQEKILRLIQPLPYAVPTKALPVSSALLE